MRTDMESNLHRTLVSIDTCKIFSWILLSLAPRTVVCWVSLDLRADGSLFAVSTEPPSWVPLSTVCFRRSRLAPVHCYKGYDPLDLRMERFVRVSFCRDLQARECPRRLANHSSSAKKTKPQTNILVLIEWTKQVADVHDVCAIEIVIWAGWSVTWKWWQWTVL